MNCIAKIQISLIGIYILSHQGNYIVYGTLPLILKDLIHTKNQLN
jgi:hypothetical protein